MNPAEAKRLVIGCMALAGVLAAAGDLAGGKSPKLRTFIGATLAAAMLSVLAEFAPPVAGGLAVLVLISSASAGGVAAAGKVTDLTNGTTAAGRANRARQGARGGFGGGGASGSW